MFLQNPDGYWENMVNSQMWRKTYDYTNGSACFGDWGIDSNRNYPASTWGCCGGSTGEPCGITYRGPSPNSEPEVQNIVSLANAPNFRLNLACGDSLLHGSTKAVQGSLGFPGMAVLQFGFGADSRSPHRPENHREQLVVYTGTHDTDTALGWWHSLSADRQAETGLDPSEPHWSLIRIALESSARLAIFPLQDVLGLGSDARMNRPGELGGWRWHFGRGVLTSHLAERLRALTQTAGR